MYFLASVAIVAGFFTLTLMTVRAERVAQLACGLSILLMSARPVTSPLVPLIVVGLLGVTIARRPQTLRAVDRRLALPLLGFAAVLVFTTSLNHDPHAWKFLLNLLVLGGAFTLWGAALNDAEQLNIIRLVIGIAAVSSAYALFEVAASAPPIWGYVSHDSLGMPFVLRSQIFEGLPRAQATFGHPLLLAFTALIALILAMRSVTNPVVKGLLVALLSVGILAAGSRSAFLVALLVGAFALARRSSVIVAGYALTGLLATLFIFNFFDSSVASRFLGSASLTHRVGALDAVGTLLTEQAPTNVLIGNGFFSAHRLIETGRLPGGTFFAVDNEFVSILAEGGLLCLALLVTTIVLASLTRSGTVRLALLAGVAMFFSFDLLAWSSSTAILGLLLGMAGHCQYGRLTSTEDAPAGAPHRVAAFGDGPSRLTSAGFSTEVFPGTTPRAGTT